MSKTLKTQTAQGRVSHKTVADEEGRLARLEKDGYKTRKILVKVEKACRT